MNDLLAKRVGLAGLALGLALGVPGALAQDSNGAGTGQGEATQSVTVPTGGGADLVSASEPERLVELIRDTGYRAVLETDNVGDPLIVLRIAGYNSTVMFDRCVDNADCDILRFTTRFIQDDSVSLETINDWNRDKLLGKAFNDSEGAAVLVYDINLGDRMTTENFKSSLDWWDLLLSEFAAHIDF